LNSLTKGSSVSVLAVLSKTKQTKHLHHLNSSFDESLSLQGIYYRLSRVRLKEILDTPFIAKKKKNLHNLILLKIQSAPHLDNEKKWRNILLALISGEKTFLPQRETLLYKWSGTMHIFTISGLHIGILAVLIYKLLSLFYIQKNLQIDSGNFTSFFICRINWIKNSCLQSILDGDDTHDCPHYFEKRMSIQCTVDSSFIGIDFKAFSDLESWLFNCPTLSYL
jgi:hypothetical protein